MNKEYDRLENISTESRYSVGLNDTMVRYSYRVAQRWIREPRILELGPAEGLMTDFLVSAGNDVTVVEGSRLFCDEIAARHPAVRVVHSVFEEFRSEPVFDTVILGHVLEHVEDPVQILQLVRNWLSPGGRVFAAVPNARSVHRQAAVLMGLLNSEDELNETDVHFGHRRVFNPEDFRALFPAAGLAIEFFGGYWLKPVSNTQMAETWNPEMIEAFFRMGERYPDIAAEIYVVAQPKP